MKCPVCSIELKMADRQGVEIDYCPQCRGVWLDRGELDKIIERSATAMPGRDRYDDDDDDDRRRYQDREDNQSGHYKRKRKSFLDDIFDF